MKKFLSYISLSFFMTLSLFMSGCHDEPEYVNTGLGNFEALWDIIDRHYCYLDEKGIDWDEVRVKYRARLKETMTAKEFFDILSDMLDELQDGHVNLISDFEVSYYRAWWTDYPQNFNLRTLQQYYLGFDYAQVSGMTYKIIDEEIGYIYYPSFASYISSSALDNIFLIFSDCKALIIDIRNNGGGLLSNINGFVGRFITEDFTGGYLMHKTGPGHNDFSEPYPVVYKPAPRGHVMWEKPVVVLTNRSCFSSANDFVSVMKQLPQVKIIGARTGGGGGLPFTYELPIGWSVRFSTSPMLDAEMKSIEYGIDPSPGMSCDCNDEDLAAGKDAILDRAIEYCKTI